MAGDFARPDTSDESSHGTRHEHGHWSLRGGFDAGSSARRLHKLDTVAKPFASHCIVEARDVAGDLWPDVRVQADGRESFELSIER